MSKTVTLLETSKLTLQLGDTKTFTMAEVAKHHTTASVWISVSGKVYDVTTFMDGHPGGEELLLQYGGRDITNVMKDDSEHNHSDTAYEMLEEYCIGRLENYSASDVPAAVPKKKFIDMTKPMVWQIWKGDFGKDFYLEQVHTPRHSVGSPPMLGWPVEFLSRSPWWVIPIFWSPIIFYCMTKCLEQQTMNTLLSLFPVGIFAWTIIEYTLHRYLFHLDEYVPDHRFFLTLHFLLHGVHHFLPMDKMRLVMPPALGFALALPFWNAYVYMWPNGVGQGLIAGSFFGFAAYDCMHYYIHHGVPFSAHLREMKSYHLDHHYKNSHEGFGITSKLWDRVFGTLIVRE